METAACFVNGPVKALQNTSHPSTSEIESIFARVQDTREERVTKLVADAHAQQRLEALETTLQKFTALCLLPLSDKDEVMLGASCNIPLSEKLDMFQLAAASETETHSVQRRICGYSKAERHLWVVASCDIFWVSFVGILRNVVSSGAVWSS